MSLLFILRIKTRYFIRKECYDRCHDKHIHRLCAYTCVCTTVALLYENKLQLMLFFRRSQTRLGDESDLHAHANFTFAPSSRNERNALARASSVNRAPLSSPIKILQRDSLLCASLPTTTTTRTLKNRGCLTRRGCKRGSAIFRYRKNLLAPRTRFRGTGARLVRVYSRRRPTTTTTTTTGARAD